MLGIAKASAAALSAVAAGVAMGGWATITVKDLPEYFVAGQQYTIEFQVRQHGRKLLGGLEPRLLVATSDRRLGGLMSGKDETGIAAVAQSTEGAYAATFTAPNAERVFLTIKSGFGNSDLRLYPEPVVPRGTTPVSLSAAERGQILFVAKGCNTCHANADLKDRPDNPALAVGPALGGGRLTRAYVIQKVKNPNPEAMPNLGLSDTEVSAIAAFLSNERGAAAGR
jgi:cytochrome c553